MTDLDWSHELNRGGVLEADLDGEDARRVMQLLRSANYSEQGFRAAGVAITLAPQPRDLRAMAGAIQAEETLATLIRVFFLGVDEDRAGLERLLEGEYESFLRLGLLEGHGRHAAAALRLTPWAGLILAHDAPSHVRYPDHVLGPVRSSATLAQLTVRRRVDAALDLGAGCGVQALLAAGHTRRVVATDVNRRALALTTLNAALNDVSNIEVREGSLFEPLNGERFGLIVANPPFVISPEREYLFRDSAMPLDEISRSVVAHAGRHLEGRGFATVMVNWILRSGEDWRDGPGLWLDGAGCDALLIHYATEDPSAYAQRWNAHMAYLGPAPQRTAIDRWLAYYREAGIEAIASGAIVLRRAVGVPSVHSLQMEYGSSMMAGEHIQSVFAGRDYLASLASDDTMLGHVIRLVGGTRLEPGETVLVQPEGLGIRGRFPLWFVDVLRRLDGARTLGEIVNDVVRGTGGNGAGLCREAVRAVRGLLECGFLEPTSRGRVRSRADPSAIRLGAPVDSD